MDWQRLKSMMWQRFLGPTTVGAALWIVTEYTAFMIGGTLLGALLFLLARPVLETLDEFLVDHFETLRARRRTRLLKNFVRFLLAYKAILTKYPPQLLADLEEDMTVQLHSLQKALQEVRQGRMFRSTILYEVVRGTTLTVEHFAHREIYDCQDWMQRLTVALQATRNPLLSRAIQRFCEQPDMTAWQAPLRVAEEDLDRRVLASIEHWHCLQRAHVEPAIRERLCTLLRLEAVLRQGGMATYLTSPQLQCSREEIAEIMEVIRYETVADYVLALLGSRLSRDSMSD